MHCMSRYDKIEAQVRTKQQYSHPNVKKIHSPAQIDPVCTITVFVRTSCLKTC